MWPYQEKPIEKHFSVWRRLLATGFLNGNRPRVLKTTRDLTLETPLGEWTQNSIWFQQKWKDKYKTNTRGLLLLDAKTNEYNVHNRIRRSKKKSNNEQRQVLYNIIKSKSTKTITGEHVPVEIENCGNYIRMREIWKTKKKIIIQKGTWETYIQNLLE